MMRRPSDEIKCFSAFEEFRHYNHVENAIGRQIKRGGWPISNSTGQIRYDELRQKTCEFLLAPRSRSHPIPLSKPLKTMTNLANIGELATETFSESFSKTFSKGVVKG
jgi:hypothetical protein